LGEVQSFTTSSPIHSQLIEPIVLESARARLAGELLESLSIRQTEDFARDQLVLSLRSLAWAQHETAIYEFEEARMASWWQHFKRSHFPAWALQRWPVRYVTWQRRICVNLRALWPDAPGMDAQLGGKRCVTVLDSPGGQAIK